jgi:hypothetical protein
LLVVATAIFGFHNLPWPFGERGANERNGLLARCAVRQALGLEPQHAVAQATELAIAPLVRTRTPRVIGAIDFRRIAIIATEARDAVAAAANGKPSVGQP